MAELMRTNAGLARPALNEWLGWDPFRTFFGNYGGAAGMEINRTDAGYTVEIPVAGFKPDQIDVTLENGLLSVVGKTDKRSFTRTLLLPDRSIRTTSLRVEHGLLTLTLNVHPKAQPKKIQISSGE